MAVLNGELNSNQGMPSTSVASLQAFSTIRASAVLDSLLVSYGSISSSAGYGVQTFLNAIALLFTSFGSYQPYQSSFVRFFGEGFKQDSSKIYIQKASLLLLTPLANNTAESLLTALLLQAKTYESNSLISNVVIELFNQSLVLRDDETLIQSTLLIKLYKIAVLESNTSPNYSGGIINPSSQLSPNDFI